MNIKENVKDQAVWTRGLYVVLFGIIYYFLFFLVVLIAVFQFLMRLFTTKFNDELLAFSDSLAEYVSQILRFITFKSDDRPYPFSPWPVVDSNESKNQDVKTTATKKKSSRKKASKKTASSSKSSPDSTSEDTDKSS